MVADRVYSWLFSGLGKRVCRYVLQWIFSGTWRPFLLARSEILVPRTMKRLGLYLHVPFCQQLCPFCPYHRLQYEREMFSLFERAIKQEIDLYARLLHDHHGQVPEIVSLYVGGGTPTIEPDSLARIIAHLRHMLGEPRDICVELHPSAMAEGVLDTLRQLGTTMLSIGVQSLNDRLLKTVGRSHDAATAADAVRRASSKNFATVNADIMFALPTQSIDELADDIQQILALGVDQISTYPFCGFPHSDLGHRLGFRDIRRPDQRLLREMFTAIRRLANAHGFSQCGAWFFARPTNKKFDSLARHHYIGLGPSAASMTGSQFYINTFSLIEYARVLPDRLPAALATTVDRRMEMAYWLYWRFYEMRLASTDFRALFDEDLDHVFGGLLTVLKWLGVLRQQADGYTVTETAAYWLHRLQNEYALACQTALWGQCQREAWPGAIRIG